MHTVLKNTVIKLSLYSIEYFSVQQQCEKLSGSEQGIPVHHQRYKLYCTTLGLRLNNVNAFSPPKRLPAKIDPNKIAGIGFFRYGCVLEQQGHHSPSCNL